MSASNAKIFHVGHLFALLSFALAQVPEDAIPFVPPTAGIVHGVDVLVATKWPWQVFIELNNGSNQCGGTLISDQWILTAAHCFDGGRSVTKIVMGTNLKSGKSRQAVIGAADIVCCHKKYDAVTLDYDICIIKLTERHAPSSSLRSVSLPVENSQIDEGTTCYVTGWGYDENFALPDILQEATVKIVARQTCIDWHKSQGITVVNNTICAGHEQGGADSCGGDSGGPLVCMSPSGLFVLQGVTSYGPSYCGAAKSPGIYTKVSAYIDWIQNKMLNPCLKTQWSPWVGGCSVTCGFGTRIRKRTCLDTNGKKVAASLCNGRSEERGICIQKACPTYTWSDWSRGSCSKTCGDAVRTDERFCLSGNGTRTDPGKCTGSSTMQHNCTLPSCPVPYFWGPWAERCSVTCGLGTRTRSRVCTNSLGQITNEIARCAPGTNVDFGFCQMPDCPSAISWEHWGPWSACQGSSVTFMSCSGVSYATRTCSLSGLLWLQGLCSGEFQRSRKCVLPHCVPQDSPFPFELRPAL